MGWPWPWNWDCGLDCVWPWPWSVGLGLEYSGLVNITGVRAPDDESLKTLAENRE